MGRLSANWLKAHKFEGDVLYETGSKAGTGAKYCAKTFKLVHTIELSEERFLACRAALRNIPNIKCHHGHSPAVLEQIINPRKRAVFFLDAHYVATDPQSAGAEHQCPLMAELRSILNFDWKHPPIVVIDDEAMFTEAFWETEAAAGYRRKDWPTFTEITEYASARGYEAKVVDSAIVLTKRQPTTHVIDAEDEDADAVDDATDVFDIDVPAAADAENAS